MQVIKASDSGFLEASTGSVRLAEDVEPKSKPLNYWHDEEEWEQIAGGVYRRRY